MRHRTFGRSAARCLSSAALRVTLSNRDVSTVIPRMRRTTNVRANVASANEGALASDVRAGRPTACSFSSGVIVNEAMGSGAGEENPELASTARGPSSLRSSG
jgi:hypothetical protein